MSVIVAIVLGLLGFDSERIVDAQIDVCRATGGQPDVRAWGYQTLAACSDERGWPVTCPGSYHSGRDYLGCWRP